MNTNDLKFMLECNENVVGLKLLNNLKKSVFLEMFAGMNPDFDDKNFCISDNLEADRYETYTDADFEELIVFPSNDFDGYVKVKWHTTADQHAESDDGFISYFFENVDHDIQSLVFYFVGKGDSWEIDLSDDKDSLRLVLDFIKDYE